MKYIRLPAPISTTPPTVAIELIEHYADPGVLEQIRFYPCIEQLAPDPAWVRPMIADPEFVAPEDEPDAEAPLIADHSAEHPQTMQYFRHPMLAGLGKLPEVYRSGIDFELADFHAALDAAGLSLDDEGIDPVTRVLLKVIHNAQLVNLQAVLGG